MKMTWEKFWAMPFKGKLEHIWEYYRWHILITLVILWALGSWGYSALTHQDPVLQVEMVNAYGNSDGSEAFQEFLEQQGISYYEDCVVIGRNIQMNSEESTRDVSAVQMLVCTVAAGEPDLIFWDSPEIIPVLNGGVLLDLREFLPEDLLRKYADRLVYADDPEGNGRYPCAVYLEKNPWMMEHKYYVNSTVSVSVTAKDRALAGNFLRYLLEAEQ